MLRIRSLDELSRPFAAGFSSNYGVPVSRYYNLHATALIGRKKVTVDNPRPLHDYRYELIPTVKTKRYRRTTYLKSTYRGQKPKWGGRKVKSFVTVSYTKYINLKRPKRGLRVDGAMVRLNDFQVAQFLGYSTIGTLKTPSTLPSQYSPWNMTGTFAAEGFGDPNIQTEAGLSLIDLTRPLELDTAYAQTALARAMAKVSAPDVDFAEIVGELEQLVRLIEDPFKTLGKLLRKFQRVSSADAWVVIPRNLPSRGFKTAALAYNALDIPTILSGPLSVFTFRTRRKVGRREVSRAQAVKSAASAALTEAANRWLQYRYGVVPLISDITEIIRKFTDTIRPLVKVYVQKSTCVSKRTSKTWISTRASVIPGFSMTYRITVSTFDRTTAKVYYRMNTLDKIVDLRDLGMDTSNAVPAAWNLTPWSFVVDWFYGIESWFRTFNQDPKLTILSNCVSRKRDINVRISILSATYFGIPCQVPQSRFYIHRAELCRKVNQPVPEYPVFNPDFLKWRRVLDTISLLWAKMPAIRR